MGILSKIFKPFKKIIKGVGKAIKGVAKIIAKPIKAVLKPIGKIFGKLGPIGTIALGFILPGLGGALGSWFNAAGGAFQNLFAPNSFMHNAIGSIGEAIKGAAKFGGDVYNKTVGRVFDSISGAIKGGIEGLTGNKLENFGKWTESFMDKITYKGELGIQPPSWQTASAAETASWTDKIYEAAQSAKDSITGVFGKTTGTPDVMVGAGRHSLLQEPEEGGYVAKILEENKPPSFFDKIRGKIQDVKDFQVVGSVSVGDIHEAKSMYDSMTAEDPRFRMTGTQGASAFSMLANMPGAFGSSTNFAQMDLNMFNNTPNFMDLLSKYAGAYGATMTPRMENPFGFVTGLGGYGFTPEDAAKQGGGW